MNAQSSSGPVGIDERPPTPIKYASRRSLLSLTQQFNSGIHLFVPAPAPAPLGEQVRMKVMFGDCTRNFYVLGRVGSSGEYVGEERGFRLLIQTNEEKRSFAHVQAFCARNKEAGKRVTTWIECTVRVGGARGQAFAGRIRDISVSGLFVAGKGLGTAKALAPHTHVEIEVKGGFLGLSKTSLKAVVVWRGEKERLPGIGAEFSCGHQQIIDFMRKNGLRAG